MPDQIANNTDRPNELHDNLWEISRSRAKIDYVVKRIAVATIFLINLAMLGAGIYYLVMHVPIPMEAYYLTPFVVGIVSALIYLGYPTCGASAHSVSQFTNPAVYVGKFSAYLFFGPLALMISRMDWTAYHDRDETNEISTHLKNDSFREIFEQYGRHFKNLMKYGFIPKRVEYDRPNGGSGVLDVKSELLNLRRDYKPIHRRLRKYEHQISDQARQRLAEAQAEAARIEQSWNVLKAYFASLLPEPQLPEDPNSIGMRVDSFTRRWLTGDPNPPLMEASSG